MSKQIGDVVDVERLDKIDRQKLDPRVKLQLLAMEAKAVYGRDPRGDNKGMAIVGRPRVILQLLLDLGIGAFSTEFQLHKPIVIGTTDADLVMRWMGCPVIVRCNVVDDQLWCLPVDKIPESKQIDRLRAGELRLNAHGGTLSRLRDSDGA